MPKSQILNASVTDSTLTTTKLATPNLGRRNLIINGAMNVAQRGTSTTGITSGGYYTVDRFRFGMNGRDEGVYTNAQVSDAPSGFSSSFKVTTTTAESAIDADDLVWTEQRFEGQNLQQLKNGSSDAEKVTLSFYVKSSITGTFGVSLYKPENTFRIINATYTINSANTWEQKVITFDGDTSGGGIDNDNTEALRIAWHLASGSTYDSTNSTSWADYNNSNWAGGHAQDGVITTTNATWQLTGVQLEVGDFPNGTPFEHRSFGEELALCQRYFYKFVNGNSQSVMTASAILANYIQGSISFPVTMRSAPTFESSDGTNHFQIYSATSGAASFDAFGAQQQHINGITLLKNGTSITAGQSAIVYTNSSSAFLNFDSEL